MIFSFFIDKVSGAHGVLLMRSVHTKKPTGGLLAGGLFLDPRFTEGQTEVRGGERVSRIRRGGCSSVLPALEQTALLPGSDPHSLQGIHSLVRIPR